MSAGTPAPAVAVRVIAAGGPLRQGGALGELWRYRALVVNLLLADLRIKYRDASLGIVWSLLQPLAMLAVYHFAFGTVLRVGVPDFALFLLAGLLPWQFFAGTVASSTTAVVDRAMLLRKIAFPWAALPLARVLFHLVQLGLTLAVFVPVALAAFAVAPRWAMLLVVPLAGLHVLFALGLALALSVLTVRWRDLAHLTETLLPLVFLLTPIAYPADSAPAPARAFFALSPLAAFATAWQDVLFRGQAPAAGTLLAVSAWGLASLVAGVVIVRRVDARLVEAL